MTVGVPFPPRCVLDAAELVVLNEGERALASQARALDLWPDRSVRWALLDFQVVPPAQDVGASHLTIASAPGHRTPGSIRVSSDPDGHVTVDTGLLQVGMRPGGRFPFESVTCSGRPLVDTDRSSLRVVRANGENCPLELSGVAIEDSGDVRAVVRLTGIVRSVDGPRDLAVSARLHFYSGSPDVRFDVTLLNPERAHHPGGIWTLGAGGSILIRDVSLDLALPPSAEPGEVLYSPESGPPLQQGDLPFELYQESSGGPNWRSHNHANREGVVPFAMKGYRVRSGSQQSHGLRATPTLVLKSREHAIALAMRQFWQNFPKALRATGTTITLSLFPPEFPDLHEIQGGERKTHTFAVAFGLNGDTDLALVWYKTPLLAHAGPEWYASTGAIPYLTPAAADPNTDYVGLVNTAIEGEDTFERKREAIDEYGWRNFGDLYADHEAVLHSGREPLVSHYNDQYDAVAGFACQFLRSGDPRWWPLMDDLARHVTDIDIYHTTRDKAAFNEGLFWHTYHYVDVGLSTHRAYPKASGVNGGGPANEHNYTTGLMLHHFLTGDPASRDAVVGLGRWVLDMDDGDKTVFRWLARGDTGLASLTASWGYHGPGRGAGNSVNALLDAHRLTGERRFLDKAEQLVRRCIHPADDVAAREFLDPERRWSYTVFLRALGKYLEHKYEHGEIDSMYAYAHESLLHYARWMAVHERPYLDKPEILEYPTETWPALDMKKSEVFMVASRHADPKERSTFLERARFFFHYSVSALRASKTRALTRPLVLMLSHGLMWAWFQRYPDAALPSPPVVPQGFGVPQRFVAQKDRAKRRAAALLAMAAALVAGVATLVLLR